MSPGRRARGWRAGGRRPHHRAVRRTFRRTLALGLTLATLSVGTAACGGGDDVQGRQEPDLSEVESQVAQLRLEVQTLRREVQSLREAVPTTTTLAATDAAPATTTTRPG